MGDALKPTKRVYEVTVRVSSKVTLVNDLWQNDVDELRALRKRLAALVARHSNDGDLGAAVRRLVEGGR